MKQNGFTLIELMTAVAVLALLMTMAVPSYRSFTATQRLRAASFDLRTDLLLARSEALKRNTTVTIERRASTGWKSGWTVKVDSSALELRARNDVGTDVDVSVASSSITFNGSGRVSSPSGTVQFALTASTGSTDLARCIVLDASGMPKTYAEACS